MSAWKTMSYQPDNFPPDPLQWGHADVGVEDSESYWKQPLAWELQWGHADVGVEDGRLK